MERRLTGMIAAAAVLIVLFIVWDAFRARPRRANAPSEADAPLRIVEPPPAAAQVPQQPTAPPSTTSQGTAVPAGPAGGGGPRALLHRAAGALGDAASHSVEWLEHLSGRDARGEWRLHAAALGESHDRAHSRAVLTHACRELPAGGSR